ncbi:hypothetical protein L3X38_028667 [Prunus dulcis]|uniref:Uncharacterized protein n=1 Tax=Prunus dulcis TaxID=3755 RepID=A0AAD4VQ78_PRUDU|nr:hypothetical protein L3X38_028667 [Prunus dulcis]
MSDLIRRRRAVTTTPISEPPTQQTSAATAPASAATAPALMDRLAFGPAGSQAPASSASSVAQPVSARRRHRPASATDTTSTDASGSQPDVILEKFGSSRKIEEGVKLVEGSGVVQLLNDQIEVKGSFDVLNMRGTRNRNDTLDSTTNMERTGKQIKGSVLVQNQIDVIVTEPASPTFGLDAMNMQGTRDENEPLVSIREAANKQIKGMRMSP